MNKAVSKFLAVVMLVIALFPKDSLSAGGFPLWEAKAESTPSVATFNWNGVWQYSATEQQYIGPINPLSDYNGPMYKDVRVTETISISPTDKLKDFSYIVQWEKTSDDGANPTSESKQYLATVQLYEGGNGKSFMTLVPYDGTNVDYGYYSYRLLYQTDAGDIYSTDFGKTYARTAEGPTMEKELTVSGVLLGPDGKALPRMKMLIEVYYDDAAMKPVWEDDLPDLRETLTSDLKGAYFVKIPIRGDIRTTIGVVITLTLRCQLPQGDAFFMGDYQDPNAKDEIRVSTKVVIDPSQGGEAYDALGEIPVARAIQFADVPNGCVTRDDAGAAEPMQSNLTDPQKLFGYSYVYRVLWDALTVGGVILDELSCLMQSPTSDPLRIDCNYLPDPRISGDRSHYSSSLNAIRLTADRCLYDDLSRFAALHEYGHFVDAATNGWKSRCNYAASIGAGDVQHGGYLNASTADSFVEGFATWYACVCQIARKDANPYMVGSRDISNPEDWRAWARGGTEEETSVSSVMVVAMSLFDNVHAFWKDVLRQDRGSFYDYYGAMAAGLGAGSSKERALNAYIIDAGLFRMPTGNGQFDSGEPFRDLNGDGHFTAGGEPYTDTNGNGKRDPDEPFDDGDGNNRFDANDEPFQDGNGDGQYDFGEAYTDLNGSGSYTFAETYTDLNGDGAWTPGESYQDLNGNGQYDTAEPYGDLMYPFDASAGVIDTSQFPASFDANKAALGESAAFNYPNRKSTALDDNGFITLSGEKAGALKVSVRLTDGVSYAYTMAPEARGVYVGLPNREMDGTVEISVPGGSVIYRSDVRTLQQKIAQSAGQSIPLDSASIRKNDLAPAGTIAAPTGGDADASGVFVPVEVDNREAGILASHYDPDAGVDSMPEPDITPEQPAATAAPKVTAKPKTTATPKATARPKATATPEPTEASRSPVVAVAAGEYFTLGLRQDGTVVAAGYNGMGQCDVSGWTEIEAIAAGLQHSVGLTRDGTVVATGDDELGQCDVEDWEDIVQISAGYGHTVGLKGDGTVVAAGYNGDGQCNVGKWRNIIAVAAGGWHTIGLKANGTVVATGYNKYGQCDVKKWSGITAIAAGGWHTIGIRENGRAVSAGYGENGQRDVAKWRSVTAVSASGYHTVGLVEGVAPIAAGSDDYGQCEMSLWENVTAIAAGGYHTVGLMDDGSVAAVGNDDYGQCEVADWSAGPAETYDGSGE